MALSMLNTPLKNIKTVTIGGYIFTIFGWPLGLGLQVAYTGTAIVSIAPFERIPSNLGISSVSRMMLATQF